MIRLPFNVKSFDGTGPPISALILTMPPAMYRVVKSSNDEPSDICKPIELFGYSLESPLDKPVLSIVHPPIFPLLAETSPVIDTLPAKSIVKFCVFTKMELPSNRK